MSAEITNADAQYAFDLVKAICTEVGPGLPASAEERVRAAGIKQALETHLGPANVQIEEFSLAPVAFLSAYPLSALFMLAAVLLSLAGGRLASLSPWLAFPAALVFSVLAPLVYGLEFFLSLEAVDPFLPKKRSVNVAGTLRRPGTSRVTRLLLVSGHHDSAPENTWLGLVGYGFFLLNVTFFLGLFATLVLSLIQLAGLVAGSAALVRVGTLGWVLLVFPIGPAIVFGLTFSRGWKNGGSVPGAVDNLAASALTVALCRFLVNNPSEIPAGTEIRFLSFGSEEAGLRGSRRYVARHLSELKALDARLLNFEMVAHPEITIFASDVNGVVPHAPAMVKGVAAAAGRAGVPHQVQPAFLGVGTDAAPFSRAGLKAATLFPFKVPEQMVAFYHQPKDGPEVLALEPLLNVLKLTLEWVRGCGE